MRENDDWKEFWNEGHAAAMRGDVMEEECFYSGDDAHNFQIGFECGRHDLKNACEILRTKLPTPERCAEIIDVPLEHWPGKCYAIACALIEHRIVDGRAVYGAYLGDVALGTLFSGRPYGMINHGWIESDRLLIVDPTRWVFSGTEPTISVLPPNKLEYDEGASVRADMLRQPFPGPTKNATITLSDVAREVLLDLGIKPPSKVDTQQLVWIANTTVRDLGQRAVPLYTWLDSMERGGLVPQDNRAQAVTMSKRKRLEGIGLQMP